MRHLELWLLAPLLLALSLGGCPGTGPVILHLPDELEPAAVSDERLAQVRGPWYFEAHASYGVVDVRRASFDDAREILQANLRTYEDGAPRDTPVVLAFMDLGPHVLVWAMPDANRMPMIGAFGPGAQFALCRIERDRIELRYLDGQWAARQLRPDEGVFRALADEADASTSQPTSTATENREVTVVTAPPQRVEQLVRLALADVEHAFGPPEVLLRGEPRPAPASQPASAADGGPAADNDD